MSILSQSRKPNAIRFRLPPAGAAANPPHQASSLGLRGVPGDDQPFCVSSYADHCISEDTPRYQNIKIAYDTNADDDIDDAGDDIVYDDDYSGASVTVTHDTERD